MANDVVAQVKASMVKLEKTSDTKEKLLVPTGSLMLNLACSDTIRGGYSIGKMVNLIGDSSSGKSFIALTMIMDMSLKSAFDEYRFIYDDVEQACAFDIPELFGEDVQARLEAPRYEKDGAPRYSDTIQNFHANIDDAINGDAPFIYILDSLDSLTSREEQTFLKTNLTAYKEDKDTTGSYGMERAKILGQILRMTVSGLEKKRSFLLIISQTRDNISIMSFAKKTRSGGKALKFYASHEIWLAAGMKEKRKERVIGGDVKAKVTKNKLTGKNRDVSFKIFYDYGIDDIGACIDFLVLEKAWEKDRNTIVAENLSIKGTKASLIKQIESKNLENELFEYTGIVWNKIEDSLKGNRKRKFQKT